MIIVDAWNELRSFLQLEGHVVSMQGRIDVGDVFTVRFTARNAAPQPLLDSPLIRFTRPYLYVYRSDYARPLLPDGTVVDGYGTEMPDVVLEPGGLTSLDVRLKAISAITGSGIAGWLATELAARAWVTAHVDPEALLKMSGYTEVKAQIWPKISVVPRPRAVARGRSRRTRTRKP